MASSFQSATLEEFAPADLDWDIDYRQLSPGDADCSFVLADLGQTAYVAAHLGPTLEQFGRVPKDRFVFTFAPDQIAGRWKGTTVTKSFVAVSRPGSEFDAVTPSDFGICHLLIPPVLLEQVCVGCGQTDPDHFAAISRGYYLSPERLHHLRWWQHEVERLLRSPCAGTSANADQLGQLGISILVDGVAEGRVDRPALTPRKRRLAIEAARYFIDRKMPQRISLPELASFAGVSIRTIEYAFNDQFGIGPKSYVQARRLHLARRRLRRASDSATVSNVAMDCGFTHFGRFAQSYRQLFGESPSQTLRSARARAPAGQTPQPEPDAAHGHNGF